MHMGQEVCVLCIPNVHEMRDVQKDKYEKNSIHDSVKKKKKDLMRHVYNTSKNF